MQMQKAIIGKKVGMTQIFDESGKVIPVTVIEAGPCVVTQKKTTEKDGYNAVQLGFEDVKESKLTKPELGHLKKAEVALKKHLKEFRVEKAAEMNVGDDQQGPRLRRPRQALRRPSHPDDPRRRPGPSSGRFHGPHLFPQPYFQGPSWRRPDGR